MASQPQLINSPWFPVLSMLSLESAAVASLALALLIGPKPTCQRLSGL
jgi:formate-dependent nitrite reductase membrane component NrfD